MKAAIIRKYGKPEVFQIEDVPEPSLKSNEVKIKVIASSLNPVDWKVRSGNLAFITGWKFPKILGGDFSGIVLECGSDVKDIKPRDEVFGLSNAAMKAAAYAEYLCCASSKLTLKPKKLTHHEAGCIPLAASTAYQALHHLGNLKAGMKVLISGATGGVGHFSVQIAKASNCYVTGICHSKNVALAKQFGCDEVLAYDEMNVISENNKFDIIFDAASKYGYLKCMHKLENNGTYIATIPTPLLLTMHGLSFIFPWKKGKFVAVKSDKNVLEKLSQLCNDGKLKPFIENTFPLSKIIDAHGLSETEKVRGKIAIQISKE